MWGTPRWQLMQPKVHISSSTTFPPRSARRSGPSALSHVSLVSSGAGPRSGGAATGAVDSTIVSSTLQGPAEEQAVPRIETTTSSTAGNHGLPCFIGRSLRGKPYAGVNGGGTGGPPRSGGWGAARGGGWGGWGGGGGGENSSPPPCPPEGSRRLPQCRESIPLRARATRQRERNG